MIILSFQIYGFIKKKVGDYILSQQEKVTLQAVEMVECQTASSKQNFSVEKKILDLLLCVEK